MKRLLGSIIAVLFVTIFAGAVFAQAPREIAPPQEVSGPQETQGLKLEATTEVWSGQGKSLKLVIPDSIKREAELLTPAPQPFPNVYSGGGIVLYARNGVRLANPFNVSWIIVPDTRLSDNLEKVILGEFLVRNIPIPLPLVGGKEHLLLRIETSESKSNGFLMVVYYTPVNNVLFEE